MDKIIIINASPRAPRSNSKIYANSFIDCCKLETNYKELTKNNHQDIINSLSNYKHLVFVFPLYVDGIPSTLLNFLKLLENNTIHNKPIIHILINCGFIEYNQNNIAIEMINIFCKQNNYQTGSTLSIGGGEGLPTTPFKKLCDLTISRFSNSIVKQKYRKFNFTMPITKKFYIKASTKYWLTLGIKNGLTKEDMETMEIEK